ncbi:MAG: CvpA family protein [Clostridiales bacterium]|nr:CvpA family protein [Clostridiales bacterium]
MNIIDFIIIAVILICMGLGYYRGFFKVVMNLLEYILSIFLAFKFYPSFMNFLNEKFLLNEFMHDVLLQGMKSTIENNMGDQAIEIPIEALDIPMVSDMANMVVMVISMFVLFLIFRLLIKIVSFFVEKLTKLPVLKEFNKIGGLIAGLVEGVIIVFLGIAVLNFFNNEAIDAKLEESLIGDKFSSTVANFTVSLINKL